MIESVEIKGLRGIRSGLLTDLALFKIVLQGGELKTSPLDGSEVQFEHSQIEEDLR